MHANHSKGKKKRSILVQILLSIRPLIPKVSGLLEVVFQKKYLVK